MRDSSGELKQRTFRNFTDDGKLSWESIEGLGNYIYEYDLKGNVTRSYGPDSDPVTGFNWVDRSYNEFGQVLTETDVRGNTTSHEYDAHGNLLWSKDSLGNITSNTYENGRLKTQTDALGNRTVYTYYDGGPATIQDGRRGDLKSIDGCRAKLIMRPFFWENG